MRECPICGGPCQNFEHHMYGGFWCECCRKVFNGDGDVTGDFDWDGRQ